jgi:DNA-binding LacI/PurR family transcriptional regulator
MHSFFVEIVAGLETLASARGTGCCCAAPTRIPRRSAELEMLRQRQVDGIVLASVNASGNTDLLQKLGALGHWPGDDRSRRSSGGECDRVLTDDQKWTCWRRSHLDPPGAQGHQRPTIAGAHHAREAACRLGFGAAFRLAWRTACRPDWNRPRRGIMNATATAAMKKLVALKPRVDAGVRGEQNPAAIRSR